MGRQKQCPGCKTKMEKDKLPSLLVAGTSLVKAFVHYWYCPLCKLIKEKI